MGFFVAEVRCTDEAFLGFFDVSFGDFVAVVDSVVGFHGDEREIDDGDDEGKEGQGSELGPHGVHL